ncbi:hypothetical protein F5Y01DRAFT_300182, partial [Xylaria sp. FL0043]
MVHLIDREWRNTTMPTLQRGIAKGKATTTVSRLKLNKTSKVIRETCLATMVLLGGVAWWNVDMRVITAEKSVSDREQHGTLCRIASHWQDSSYTEWNRAGETWKGNQAKALVVVKGKRFRLGWWEDSRTLGQDDGEADSHSQIPVSTAGRRFGIDVDDGNKANSSAVPKTNASSRQRNGYTTLRVADNEVASL